MSACCNLCSIKLLWKKQSLLITFKISHMPSRCIQSVAVVQESAVRCFTCPPHSIYKLPPGLLFYQLSACTVSVQNHLTCETQTKGITMLILQSQPKIMDLSDQCARFKFQLNVNTKISNIWISSTCQLHPSDTLVEDWTGLEEVLGLYTEAFLQNKKIWCLLYIL